MCTNNESNLKDDMTSGAPSPGIVDKISRKHLRSRILNVGVATGSLCGVADTSMNNEDALVAGISRALRAIASVADAAHIDIVRAIVGKMALNARKYPVDLCKGKAGKYTKYSSITGVTKDNQSIISEDVDDNMVEVPSLPPPELQIRSLLYEDNLFRLAAAVDEFAVAREWARFHTPRNVILAMLGEVGELSELVQWMGDDDVGEEEIFSEKFLDKLGQEIADVSIYLIRLFTVCDLKEPVSHQLKAQRL